MILPSTDGQEYASALLLPDKADLDNAYRQVNAAIQAAKLGNPEGWTWEDDLLPRLEKLSCVVVPTQIVSGPVWDE
jgi:hypothetical protein